MIILVIGLFVVIGAPLVFLIWEAINQALTGHWDAVRVAYVAPAVVVLVAALYGMARVLRRWSARA
jgi:hypothetical protein